EGNAMKNISTVALVSALLVGVAGCGGGGGGSNSPPVGGNPPAPAPAPPPPPPPPAPVVVVPPVSATVQDITDGHAVGTARWSDPQTDGAAIGDFSCILNPPQTFEVYAHLSILVNNEPQRIPPRLGASPQGLTHCFYTIHTHD